MHFLHIGSNTEFVEFAVPSHSDGEGWMTCNIEIRVNSFSGGISAFWEPDDFLQFESELNNLNSRLSGTATFDLRERQIFIKLTGNGLGGIEVSGVAWAAACYGSKLEFEFALDQTFLPSILVRLNEINGKNRT